MIKLLTLLLTTATVAFGSVDTRADILGDVDRATHVTSLPVTTTDGKAFDIARQPGWRVVYFWSAECPCVKACEQCSLAPLAKQYAGKISFYAVASDGYDLSKTRPALDDDIASHHLPFAVYLDATHETALRLGAHVTTDTYVIDPANRIVFSGSPDDSRNFLWKAGQIKAEKTYLAKALREALSGKPVTEPQSESVGCIIAW